MKSINVNLVNDIENPYIIDIREPHEFNGGSIKGAINVPMNELLNNSEKYLKNSEENYILCLSGGRSQMACNILNSAGKENITNLEGGMMGYFGNL